MYIRFLTSKNCARTKMRVEVQFKQTSPASRGWVIGHRSSSRLSKENMATGIIADNQFLKNLFDKTVNALRILGIFPFQFGVIIQESLEYPFLIEDYRGFLGMNHGK
ncbi:hypothetical protein SAMN04487988_102273 [Algoriphagus hitonicola]|uniref:Uncharacterized protein n=1 Tax=Algoriphagus hitonicola TaxID=435880 RepID=A0A1I2QPL1_9BACT|nr:hypothetical protein SAMN04487988_102273 [Algoriphagus hitonicola]